MKYLARRLALSIPVLLGVTFIVFMILRLIPGDPIQVMFAGTGAPLEQREAMRHALGLDRPLPVQYVTYLGNALHGDFGESIHFGEPVLPLVLQRVPATVELTLAGLFLGLVFALPAGLLAGTRRNSAVDHVVMVTATLGISLPTFWVGILMIMLFAVNLGLLPSSGRVDYSVQLTTVTGFYVFDALVTRNGPALVNALQHLALPAMTLGLSAATFMARLTRSSVVEQINKAYVTTAHAKGLPPRTVMTRHIARNSLIPVVTLISVMMGDLLAGAVVTETIFGWPGIGRLVVQSVNSRDFPVVQCAVLMFAVLRIGINFLTDVLYVRIDPRIGHI